MVLTRFVLLAAFLLAASSVSAAVTIDLGPSDFRRWGEGTSHHHTDGLNRKFGQTIRMPPLNSNLTVTRNAVVPYGSIANGAKNFLRINPGSVAASAAITGLFLAVDWVFDQAAGEWVKVGDLQLTEPDDLNLYCRESPYSHQCAPSASSFCQLDPHPNAAGWEFPSETRINCLFYAGANQTNPRTYYSGNKVSDCPAPSYYNAQMGGCVIEGEYERLNDDDFNQLAGYLPSANPSVVGDAAHDIQRKIGSPLPGYTDLQMEGPSSVTGTETTTTTTTETGDNIVTNTQTTTNITYGDTTITTTNTTVTNTYTNGNHTSTEITTETPGELPVSEPSSGGTAGEWPGFCDWATVVCDFIDWFQEPFDAPEVEWPLIEDQDFGEEFDFTLAASCPEPYTIELALFPPVQFNWQPFCDLATFIRPLVLASAAIFAAFISLGIARART